MGLFITFEGIEGCGKTTQMRMAGEYLASCSYPFISTVEPGGTALGSRIRDILLNRGPYALCAKAELLLFCAARSQHVQEVIAPSLDKGNVVLCDRFADATVAYQGYARGLDVSFIKTLTDFSADHLKPDLTLLFDLDVKQGLSRAFGRIANRRGQAAEDRFEREEISFHDKVREGYLTLARQDPERFRIIDASPGISAIQREVRHHLDVLIKERHVL
ncbi:MAG: Thymidylate kinase [Syntrophus sp. SKADARSKE-3]|nr:Thymidylate kinase [Syntrophus sp. SKADARSKE-3]